MRRRFSACQGRHLETTVTLIEQMRDTIAARHLAQHEAAAQLGVSKRTLENWLTGKIAVPQPRHRRAIIAWLADEAAA